MQYADTTQENTSFLIINFEPLHFMRIEYSFLFTFPADNCCPIFDMDDRIRQGCFEPDELKTELIWNRNIQLKLDVGPKGSKQANCSHVRNKSYIHCQGKSTILFYEPRDQFILLGHNCADKHSLQGMTYNITATISNETSCEPVSTKECPKIKANRG